MTAFKRQLLIEKKAPADLVKRMEDCGAEPHATAIIVDEKGECGKKLLAEWKAFAYPKATVRALPPPAQLPDLSPEEMRNLVIDGQDSKGTSGCGC